MSRGGRGKDRDEPERRCIVTGDRGGKPGKGKPQGRRDKDARRDDKPRNFESRPQKKDRIDPDNPFAAALMGLKDKL